ncbi:MAG: Chromosome partition protein Smc [Mycoplasmataceae bacterium]|nr:MAG: Chromosome partition protein Smc [Mycoplasmataceae bacterium]
MNWTASLLRNQLNKQKLAYEQRINLLTNASIDVQNFLALEEKLALLTTELQTSKQSISQLTNEAKEQENLSSQEIKAKEKKIVKLEQKIKTSKDLIFKLNQQIRENQLYYQQELRKVRDNYQSKLTPFKQEITKLKEQATLIQAEKDQAIIAQQTEISNIKSELNETTNSFTNIQQELVQTKQELAFTTNKITSCEKIFVQQIIRIIKKNIILWKSKELKTALSQIKELMGWENLTLPTDTATATPAETTE